MSQAGHCIWGIPVSGPMAGPDVHASFLRNALRPVGDRGGALRCRMMRAVRLGTNFRLCGWLGRGIPRVEGTLQIDPLRHCAARSWQV